MPNNDDASASARHWAFFLLGYTILAHAIDTLAVKHATFPINWSVFQWHLDSGIDLYKVVFWLVIPMALVWSKMDWGYWGVARWKRADWIILLGIVALGAVAMAIIPLVPALDRLYGGLGSLSPSTKWGLALFQLAWTLSWLPGWEFLHRYALLVPLNRAWPKYGWLAVPLIEGAYHLQKPIAEMLGMVVFSLIVTYWARQRRNALLPFLAHLAIELELLGFQLLT